MVGVPITASVDHEMTYRECDMGNGLAPLRSARCVKAVASTKASSRAPRWAAVEAALLGPAKPLAVGSASSSARDRFSSARCAAAGAGANLSLSSPSADAHTARRGRGTSASSAERGVGRPPRSRQRGMVAGASEAPPSHRRDRARRATAVGAALADIVKLLIPPRSLAAAAATILVVKDVGARILLVGVF